MTDDEFVANHRKRIEYVAGLWGEDREYRRGAITQLLLDLGFSGDKLDEELRRVLEGDKRLRPKVSKGLEPNIPKEQREGRET